MEGLIKFVGSLTLLMNLPFVGWIFKILAAMITAFPIQIMWTAMAPIYFYWLPVIYLSIPYWHLVWLIVLIGFVKGLLLSGIFNKAE